MDGDESETEGQSFMAIMGKPHKYLRCGKCQFGEENKENDTMGDMLRCNKCSTFHYRNDPCPEFGPSEPLVYCPQCLSDSTVAELHSNEGYCRTCCRENRDSLDQHNAEFDRWEGLTSEQREAEIRNAAQGS